MATRRTILKKLKSGSKARKQLKKALKDKRVTRKEFQEIVKAGASKKQALKIRRSIKKAPNFKGAGRIKRSFIDKLFPSSKPKQPPVYKPEPIGKTQPKDTQKEVIKDDFNYNIDFDSRFANLQEQQQEFQERMTDMYDAAQMQIGSIDPVERERITGVRFADRGTGGATRRQLQRRGTAGVFSRGGLRISSLNI